MMSEWIHLKKDFLKKIIVKGNEGQRPRFWSQVNVKISKFPQDSDLEEQISLPSESSSEEEFSGLRIGVPQDEWSRIVDICLLLMDEYEVSQFRTKTRDGGWIRFQIHLISIVHQPLLVPFWEVPEVMDVSKQLKELGISLYRDNRSIDSFHLFSRALKLVLPIEVRLTKQLADNAENKDEEKELWKKEISLQVTSLYNNLAACQLANENYSYVLHLCDQALERNQSDPKTVYRKVSALIGKFNVITYLCIYFLVSFLIYVQFKGLKQYQNALDVVKIGLALDPTNKAMQNLKKKAAYFCTQQEQGLVKGMKKFFL